MVSFEEHREGVLCKLGKVRLFELPLLDVRVILALGSRGLGVADRSATGASIISMCNKT